MSVSYEFSCYGFVMGLYLSILLVCEVQYLMKLGNVNVICPCLNKVDAGKKGIVRRRQGNDKVYQRWADGSLEIAIRKRQKNMQTAEHDQNIGYRGTLVSNTRK